MSAVFLTSPKIAHSNVMKPNPNYWGTCLCATCLNPEIKLEALSKLTKCSDLIWNDILDYQNIDSLVKKVQELAFDKPISFSEWQKVEVKDGKKKKKVSRKVLGTLPFDKLKKGF